jgi:hypothetical protein
MKVNIAKFILSLCAILAVLAGFPEIPLAQSISDVARKHINAPASEKFKPASDLVSPWRSSGCPIENRSLWEPGCHFVVSDEWEKTSFVTVYDADGTVWFSFDLNPESPQYFRKQSNTELLPLSPPVGDPAPEVVLRMVAESPSWYEVEVNKGTGQTKFIMKSDPLWARTTWDFWLGRSQALIPGPASGPMLDAPDGKIIQRSADIKFERVRFSKRDGDWALVWWRIDNEEYRGWIRWRLNNEIVVGCNLTGYKVPAK